MNGQVGRMNRAIKNATLKHYHDDDLGQLERHLADFIAAYHFGRRSKTLEGLTPYEFIYKQWASEPARFRLNPFQQKPGLNI
jgi:transposase InsO family protein